ncbi:MAG: hypothetical protein RL757_2447 [Bacteroidota bacterium]|jgi:aspartyl-tRNA(Asn)/glutamyl-tRNA(Gln) amidotransferase subunit B
MSKEKYETVIGLEVHVQLSTESKAFCADSTTFGGLPNTHVGIVSLAMPGALPRANRQQIEFAARLGLALGCRINPKNHFDRKNYFYADLPKGYQITQDRQPICIGGGLEIETSLGKRFIEIHHIHMEEDAGKSIHDQDPHATLIDLNRAGVPLLEIVTQPDLRSGEEVDAFMTAMRHLVRWLGVSDGNMDEGSMRCDVNVSIREKGDTKFGTRCEVKNVNSMRFARRAIEFEFARQVDLVENGGVVEQQTLNFNPETGVTTPIRDKENANDYRYFPDPDLPPVVLSEAWIGRVAAELPMLPQAARLVLEQKFGVTAADAKILTSEKAIFDYTNELLTQLSPNLQRLASNFLVQKILPFVVEKNISIEKYPLSTKQIEELLNLINENKISASAAYQNLLPALLDAPPPVSALDFAQKMNLLQSDDTDFLEKIVLEVLENNPEKVKEYQKGKKGLIGFFMGEIMKMSKGKAEPKATQALLTKHL